MTPRCENNYWASTKIHVVEIIIGRWRRKKPHCQLNLLSAFMKAKSLAEAIHKIVANDSSHYFSVSKFSVGDCFNLYSRSWRLAITCMDCWLLNTFLHLHNSSDNYCNIGSISISNLPSTLTVINSNSEHALYQLYIYRYKKTALSLFFLFRTSGISQSS